MRRPGLLVAFIGALLFMVQTAAFALWADGSSAPADYSSGSLAAPTNPSVVLGTCDLLTGDALVLSWTATASTWADGYEVARSTTVGGPYTVVGTVSGQATTIFINATLAFSTTYSYVVRATKNSWRSANTAEVSRTTRSSLCV